MLTFVTFVQFDDLMMVLTVFVLFGPYIQVSVLPINSKLGFEVANSICMFFFIFELILNSWVKSEFRVQWIGWKSKNQMQWPLSWVGKLYYLSKEWHPDKLNLVLQRIHFQLLLVL